MKTLYILFLCDAHHSEASKKILAVCDNENKACELANKDALREGEAISKDNLINLFIEHQTQGLDYNYMIETLLLNELVE
jgi:hypothetical protein